MLPKASGTMSVKVRNVPRLCEYMLKALVNNVLCTLEILLS